MKALIVIRETSSAWLRTFFSNDHPAMIRICNKPMLEYWVDFSVLAGCTSLRIILEEPDSRIEDYFENGELWGMDISYGYTMPDDSLEVILKKNSAYTASASLLAMDGFFFIHYRQDQKYNALIQPDDVSQTLARCESGSIQYICPQTDSKSPPAMDKPPVTDKMKFPSLSPLKDFDHLLEISMRVLSTEQPHYVLPGYGTERNVTIGSNVEINRTTQVIPPVILGSNVRLLNQTVIGPHAVIGNNVIVDTGTSIEKSVIMDNSYLGKGLRVHEKFVDGNMIFSPRLKEKLVVKDGFVLSSIKASLPFSPVRTVFNAAGGLVLGVLQFIPFIILFSIRKLQNDWHVQHKSFFIDSRGKKKTFPVIKKNKNTVAGRLFTFLSLDKFPLFGAVVLGRLKLMGNLLLESTPANDRRLSDFKEYLPGAYSYSEGEGLTPETPESDIAERFHAANRSFFRDICMLAKTITR